MEKNRFSLIITGLDDSKDVKEIVKKVNDYLETNPLKDLENIKDLLEKTKWNEKLSTVLDKLHYNREVVERELKTKYFFGLYPETLNEESFRQEIMNVICRYAPYQMDIIPFFHDFIEFYNTNHLEFLKKTYKNLRNILDNNFRLFYHIDSISTMLILYPNTELRKDAVENLKKTITDINNLKIGLKTVDSLEELQNFYLDGYIEYKGE